MEQDGFDKSYKLRSHMQRCQVSGSASCLECPDIQYPGGYRYILPGDMYMHSGSMSFYWCEHAVLLYYSSLEDVIRC